MQCNACLSGHDCNLFVGSGVVDHFDVPLVPTALLGCTVSPLSRASGLARRSVLNSRSAPELVHSRFSLIQMVGSLLSNSTNFLVCPAGFGELHAGFMLAWFLVSWIDFIKVTFYEAFLHVEYADYRFVAHRPVSESMCTCNVDSRGVFSISGRFLLIFCFFLFLGAFNPAPSMTSQSITRRHLGKTRGRLLGRLCFSPLSVRSPGARHHERAVAVGCRQT